MKISTLQELRKYMDKRAVESSLWGWNDSGDVPTDPADWYTAFTFASRIVEEFPSLELPYAEPCGDGSVHLTWYFNKIRVTVERRGTKIFYSAAKAKGPYISDEATTEDEAIEFLQFIFNGHDFDLLETLENMTPEEKERLKRMEELGEKYGADWKRELEDRKTLEK